MPFPLALPSLPSSNSMRGLNIFSTVVELRATRSGVITSLTAVPELKALELTGIGLLVLIGAAMRCRWVTRTK